MAPQLLQNLSEAFPNLPTVGPILGGLTSDPVGNYPSLFGGIQWLERFPYSLPNLLSAIFLGSAALLVFFGLEEVHSSRLNYLGYVADVCRHITRSALRKMRV